MKKLEAPKDLEFEVGMINTRLDSPHMKLPEAKDRLFVTKPLMSYEPVHQDDEVKKFVITILIIYLINLIIYLINLIIIR